jgi:hypothetical protein
MRCGQCKQEGHSKNKCSASKQTTNEVIQPLMTIATAVSVLQSTNTSIIPTEFGTIEVSDTAALWSALSKMCYDNFQAFNELIDNAIAAIIASIVKKGTIYIDFNFTTNVGSIEHSGGTTFPHDLTKLANCFTYGLKNPTTLNEHGCGLKQSLAMLNPTNDKWQIWIKYVEDNSLKIIKLQAPFTNKLKIITETSWPGQDKSIEPGSYICFPIAKEKFSQLYKRDAKMADTNDLHERIRNQFSHLWMKQEEVLDRKIQLKYNRVPIIPFSFTTKEVFEFVEKTNKKEFKLSTGALVQLEEIKLKNDARKIPGSNTFKATMAATGVYLYKNGRFIESINTDTATRKLYSAIFGTVPDHHYNSYIKLVNIVGEQDKLPATVPTKNRFGDSLLFDELIDKIRINITPLPRREHVSEDSMVEVYIENNSKALKMANIPAQFEQEKKFAISETVSTPPIDLVISIHITKTIKIMEFKANTRPQLEYYQQLYFNWCMAKESSETEGKELIPILVLSPADEFIMPEQHKEYLRILAKKSEFYPMIQDTKNTILYEVTK